MSQDTKPAPFNLGDHVRYIATQRQTAPTGHGKGRELILVPGMVGVVVLSTGAFSAEGAAAPEPWRCEVQFQNGFQFAIAPDNCADFEMVHGGSETAMT